MGRLYTLTGAEKHVIVSKSSEMTVLSTRSTPASVDTKILALRRVLFFEPRPDSLTADYRQLPTVSDSYRQTDSSFSDSPTAVYRQSDSNNRQ